jgi:RNA polymerase sigma-70 factor (ECF subfamily)
MVSELGRGRLKARKSSQRSLVLGSGSTLDRNRLAAIYDQLYEPIYVYVYRQVGDVETARDLAAEVFHRLVGAVQKGNSPDRHPKAWLYRTAHNLVIDHYRRQTHREHLPLNEEMVSSSEDPATVAEQRSSAARVRMALRKLTPEQQQVLVLKFLQGLSNQEVAAVLDKSVGAVKALQHRALAALKRILTPDEDGIAG